MNVVYWSKRSRDSSYQYVELDELCRQADVLIPVIAENHETEKLITHQHIDSMQSHSILIGINRVKQLVDEKYVFERVKSGQLGGYVFEANDARPYQEYTGNVWAVPAIAWYTQNSLDNLVQLWVDNVIAVAEGKPQNLVN